MDGKTDRSQPLEESLVALRVARLQLGDIADISRRAHDDCKNALDGIEAGLTDLIGERDVNHTDFLRDMRAIVRELAESDPFRDAICVHCRRHRDDFVIERDGAGEVAHRGPHEPTCLWLRARTLAGLT